MKNSLKFYADIFSIQRFIEKYKNFYNIIKLKLNEFCFKYVKIIELIYKNLKK